MLENKKIHFYIVQMPNFTITNITCLISWNCTSDSSLRCWCKSTFIFISRTLTSVKSQAS